jgi:hypothetical protein
MSRMTEITIAATTVTGTATDTAVEFEMKRAAPDKSGRSGYAWTVANVASGTINNFDPTAFHLDSSGFVNPNPQLGPLGNFSVTTAMDGSLDDVVIDYSPAPEPTSFALFAMGAGGLLMRRRRKARRL